LIRTTFRRFATSFKPGLQMLARVQDAPPHSVSFEMASVIGPNERDHGHTDNGSRFGPVVISRGFEQWAWSWRGLFAFGSLASCSFRLLLSCSRWHTEFLPCGSSAGDCRLSDQCGMDSGNPVFVAKHRRDCLKLF
jgi:hypothetical protein